MPQRFTLIALLALITSLLVALPAAAQSSRNVAITKDKDSIAPGGTLGVRVVVTDSASGNPIPGISTTVVIYNKATNAILAESAPQVTQNGTGSANFQLQAPSTAGTFNLGVRFGTPGIVNNTAGDVLITITAASTPETQTTSGATQGELVTLPNPIRCADATCLISQVIRYILGVIAVIATLMFVWGGVLMLTSGGNSDQVRKAKETLTWAAIGVVVILMSWVIIRFVLEAVVGTTAGK